MHFTHFTIKQDGQTIGNVAVREQAVNTAKKHAEDTGRPVSVVGHIDDGRDREVIFHPDGTTEKIWEIDKGQPLTPTVGQVYINRGGGEFRCIALVPEPGTSSSTTGVFQNIKSGWTFTAKGIIQYCDGTIEWDHSIDGRFEEVTT